MNSPLLPVLDVGVGRPERADAARNRDKVLTAARKLFRQKTIAEVSMEDIAREAGVGRGTLYRRYPDKGAIAFALLDNDERELQSRILSADAPLGPGAPAYERLAAFIDAYVEFVRGSMQLLLTAEATPHARFETGAYRFWRLHCTILLADCGVDHAKFVAEVLMSSMTAEQLDSWLADEAVDSNSLGQLITATVINPHIR